jgi:hypothetical protein
MARLLERGGGQDELVRAAWRALGFSAFHAHQRVDMGLGKSRVSDGAWRQSKLFGIWAGIRIGR